MTLSTLRPRVIVYEDEIERIGRHVVDRRHAETGGELYGFVTPSGSLVLHLATGPGPEARHTTTSFHQDREFLCELFALANERHALQHLGTWHSHHGLSLAEPSGGDDASMAHALRVSGLPAFLLVIANLVDPDGRPDHEGLPELRAFLYRHDEPLDPVPCEWIVLGGASPVRSVDRVLALADTAPRARHAVTRVVPQGGFAATPAEEPAPDLSNALRNAPWALTSPGAALIARLAQALHVTGMRPSDTGQLVLDLPEGAALILGAMDDEDRLAATLTGNDLLADVTSSPEDLVSRVRDVLAGRKNAHGVRCLSERTSSERQDEETTPLPPTNEAGDHASPPQEQP